MSTPSERIRAKREELGISQERLARQIEVSRNTIARWEAGSGIDASNLERLASALGVSSDWILRGRDPEPRGEEVQDSPHWTEFVERYPYLHEFDAAQLEDIRRFAARQFAVRSWLDYERLAETVRLARPSPTFEAKRAAWLAKRAKRAK